MMMSLKCESIAPPQQVSYNIWLIWTGEKKVYAKGTDELEACNLLKDVGKTLPVTQEVLQQMTTFTLRHIYNYKVNMTLGESKLLNYDKPDAPQDPISHTWALRYTQDTLPRCLQDQVEQEQIL